MDSVFSIILGRGFGRRGGAGLLRDECVLAVGIMRRPTRHREVVRDVVGGVLHEPLALVDPGETVAEPGDHERGVASPGLLPVAVLQVHGAEPAEGEVGVREACRLGAEPFAVLGAREEEGPAVVEQPELDLPGDPFALLEEGHGAVPPQHRGVPQRGGRESGPLALAGQVVELAVEGGLQLAVSLDPAALVAERHRAEAGKCQRGLDLGR